MADVGNAESAEDYSEEIDSTNVLIFTDDTEDLYKESWLKI